MNPSLKSPACLATLNSCDTTKQSVWGWQYTYIFANKKKNCKNLKMREFVYCFKETCIHLFFYLSFYLSNDDLTDDSHLYQQNNNSNILKTSEKYMKFVRWWGSKTSVHHWILVKIYHHHHHHHHKIMMIAWILLTLTCHQSLLAIIIGRSSTQNSVSEHSWWCFC